ncbi:MULTISPECIES: phosphatase domain-containing putative toxin [Niastella]|uniref:protein-tyrosine-phosphatase n=1 Tax=Niastella soli TaxID=2821487 RepID=A0ABS3YNV5_9BACT|nr:dual specificity protein phosphatase family protein [Niastella soli]MBO9199566.1 dual specificity protein phosphatase family protein [Niastella soli]
MYTKIYWVYQFDNGAALGIMPRPRGDDWLEEEIIKLKKQHVGVWVSLLEPHEVSELGLKNQASFCSKHSLDLINFPIVDRNIPDKGSKVDQLIGQLAQKIQAGVKVVIHCRMGIGRSSIIAASILLKYGFKTDQILQKITSARGLKVPDTEQQVQWLRSREKSV